MKKTFCCIGNEESFIYLFLDYVKFFVGNLGYKPILKEVATPFKGKDAYKNIVIKEIQILSRKNPDELFGKSSNAKKTVF